MKPHLWFSRGVWWCAYDRLALLSWWGKTPKAAYQARQNWLIGGPRNE